MRRAKFGPQLAAKANIAKLDTLPYPLLGSPKIDGIRGLVKRAPFKGPTQLLSRKLIEIPNRATQAYFATPMLDGLDGELIVGPPNVEDTYRTTQKALSRHEGDPRAAFYVFDNFDDLTAPYEQRLEVVTRQVAVARKAGLRVLLVKQHPINNVEELLEFELLMLKRGYEGAMVRRADAEYKCGRATERDGIIFKVTRVVMDEAVIVGFEELEHNDNEATINELGLTKRSTHKENKRKGGTLGSFVVDWKGHTLNIGTGQGLTSELRQEIWNARNRYLGKLVKFQYKPIGLKDVPRHPVWLGFRERFDT
jgi:DNA ligase-1